VAEERTVSEIRADIEQARDQLASTVDELADRLAPSHVADQVKAKVREKLSSPAGKAAVGGAAVLLTVLMLRNLRRSRR
jgi:Tfp pilus assembly protein FimV